MNEYEEKQAGRAERFDELAQKAEAEANRLDAEARKMGEAIPFGQPILIGHHSEKRDRNYRGRISGKYDKAHALRKKAEYYRTKAHSARSNRSISSDDPDATEKIRQRITELEQKQTTMKAANAIIRRKPKNEETPEKIVALLALGIASPSRLFEPDCCRRIGFPDYALQNNNGNIRRLRQRLSLLESQPEPEATTSEVQHDGFKVREDTDINRIQIVFPGKPDEDTRSVLKSCGFRWAPSQGAWQRQLNGNGRWAVQRVITQLANT